MTITRDWEGAAGLEQEQGADQNFPIPIPVRIIREENEQIPPEFANCMTWTVPTFANTALKPIVLCPHRYHRFKAQFWIIPGATSTGLVLNTKVDALMQPNPQGATFQWTAGAQPFAIPPYEAQRALYAVALTAAVIVSVIDQAYGNVQ